MSVIKPVGQNIQHSLQKSEKTPQAGEFDKLLNETIGKVASVQKEAEEAVRSLTQGGDIAHAMLAMEKADLSFELMLEVRNKLINAYEEIMRMQI